MKLKPHGVPTNVREMGVGSSWTADLLREGRVSVSSVSLTSLAAGKGTVSICWLLDCVVTISHVPTEGEGERGQSYCPGSRGKIDV